MSENSFCHLAFPSDASDEQNSQSSMENSMNSSEQVERQPSGDAGLAAETLDFRLLAYKKPVPVGDKFHCFKSPSFG